MWTEFFDQESELNCKLAINPSPMPRPYLTCLAYASCSLIEMSKNDIHTAAQRAAWMVTSSLMVVLLQAKKWTYSIVIVSFSMYCCIFFPHSEPCGTCSNFMNHFMYYVHTSEYWRPDIYIGKIWNTVIVSVYQIREAFAIVEMGTRLQ